MSEIDFGKESDFRTRFCVILAEQEMSVKNMARALGMSYSTLQAYSGGEREPSMETITKIANGVGVPADWLAGFGKTFSFDCTTADYIKVVNAGFRTLADKIMALETEIADLKEGKE